MNRRASMLFIGVLLFCRAEPMALAAPSKVPNPVVNTLHHQVLIQELKNVHLLLAQANHDYKGHRGKAMEHISKAVHHLGGAPERHDGVAKQKLSDMQLQHAILEMQAIARQVQISHPAAYQDLSHAANELQAAVKLK